MTQDWSDLEDQVADMTLAEFSRTMPAAFREMMRRFIPLISAALERQPDNPDKWGVAFAVGASFCAGRSMADIAAKLGCSRALLSYKARQFCEDCNLPPSGYMKSEDAVETAKIVRNGKINEQQSKDQSLAK